MTGSLAAALPVNPLPAGRNVPFLEIMPALLLAVAGVFALLLAVYLMRAGRRSRGAGAAATPGGGAGDKVTFVVDTFHSLVNELKEKEKELKELRERAEVRARSIESYNEHILRSIQSGVMSFDVDGRVVTANEAADAILERAPGTTVGAMMQEVFGAGNWICRLLSRTLEEGRSERRSEGDVTTTGGKVKCVGAGTSPLSGDGGREGAILVFNDITEFKELKERMELRERLTVLGEMSAGIAHELRNPMGVISGYADLLARGIEEGDPRARTVEKIRAEIALMDRIIREFMSFSQPTEMNIAQVDVAALLRECLGAVAAEGSDVLRDVSIDEGLPLIEGDALLLRQAFINLMRNALEAMEEGGRLVVRARPAGAATRGGGGAAVEVRIADTGPGIVPDHIKKIFTPFFTTKEKGTGLGLALVQKILVFHGCGITVGSAPGKGTAFTILLRPRPPERGSE